MSIFSHEALKDQHILITGATGGIGYETAKACAAAGAHITITGRNEDTLASLKGECEELSPQSNVFLFSADLASPDDRKALIEAAEEENGPVTGLVNAAGIAGGAPLEELEEDLLRSIMELNFTSAVLLTQDVYRRMQKSGSGSVVNVSSLSGLRGTAANSAYAGSKFALIGFTQSFAAEAIGHGIRVNAVCPGYVDTKMGRDSIARKGERYGKSYEEQLKQAEALIPSGRISTPEEVAQTILFLLTGAAGNIVGESIKISGGSVM
ncbi:SDR family NAD(P)-dependent oxidoreductase [Bacillus mangrovi]|uniref:SDR family NAD(P)-dependent oxidoreductase n=1 Tax=Metabacillus mangrovi TaxID=1491830 RepID=A0A7X2V4Z2_9BACI|nr:SDR family oxidoreductase [Metabacillus mangrovi]MTH53641.1 SDR family NAD(P)-dependent oxidoreductase [Metabacillus mangrovi]